MAGFALYVCRAARRATRIKAVPSPAEIVAPSHQQEARGRIGAGDRIRNLAITIAARERAARRAGQELAGPACGVKSSVSGAVRRACRKPRSTRAAMRIARMNEAIAPQSITSPILENA